MNCRWLELMAGGTPGPTTASGKVCGFGVTVDRPDGRALDPLTAPPSFISKLVAVISPLTCPLGVNGTAEQRPSPFELRMINALTVAKDPEPLVPHRSAAAPFVALGLMCGRPTVDGAEVVSAT